MNVFEKKPEIRWSDLDPNYHVRHSAYYDYGAYSRISFFNEYGITTTSLMENNIGPILFREECVFRKEIKFGDEITINLRLDKASYDMSRWTIVHEIKKDGNILAAVMTVDGAWIDTQLRKLTKPPELFRKAFEQIPRTERFEYIERK
jgi:acyl-CoA thioester hydrolase